TSGAPPPPAPARAEAGPTRGLSDLNAAQGRLAISKATYTQVIGNPPTLLQPAQTVDRFGPRDREDAIQLSYTQHPAVLAAGFDVDVASTQIRVAESSLLPTITVQGNASTARDNDPT